MKKIFLLIVLAFFLVSSTAIQEEYILKKGFTVAFSKDGYDKMMDAVANKDRAYFKKLQEDQEILTLPNDIPVYILERHVFSGYSEVRVKGKDIKLWTVNEALKKK